MIAVQRDAALEVVFGSADPLSVVLRLEAEVRWHEEFGRQLGLQEQPMTSVR